MSDSERLKLLSAIAQRRSRMVLTSGGVEPVIDSAGGGHSAFAQAFLEVLRANVGVMLGQVLFTNLQLRVAAIADRVQMRQVPEYAPIKYAGHERVTSSSCVRIDLTRRPGAIDFCSRRPPLRDNRSSVSAFLSREETSMRLRWIAGALAMMGLVAVAAPAGAQGLNDVLNRLLSNNCAQLGAGPFGPDLSRLCVGAPSGSGSSSGGSVGSEGSVVSDEQRQLFRRLRQRQGGAASADPANPLGVGAFVTTEYEKFKQDNTRFETGFDRDTVGMSFGADYLFRNGLILGAAFTYAPRFR